MEINVLIDRGIRKHPKVGWLRSVVEQVLAVEGASPDSEVGLLITGQERVQELNRIYRGKDQPTDVLSFCMLPAEETGSTGFVAPPDGLLRLGEVVVSYPQAVLQAKEAGHSVNEEIAVLIVHGVLHLLGHDHEKPGEKRRMQAREKKILGHIPQD